MERSSAALTRTHRLAGGLRVRLRLARPGDEAPLADFLGQLGFDPSTPELVDLIRFDPHQRALICATALIDGREQLLGFGLIDTGTPRAPATVVADSAHGPDLIRLLRDALRDRVPRPAGRERLRRPVRPLAR